MRAGSRARAARGPSRSAGFTLIEVAIVVVIIGVVSAMALPSVSRYFETGRSRAAARSVADAFNLARAQAIRTGNNHIVFFSIGGAGDAAGNTLRNADNEAVPILVLNDGAPGSANQNCEIDSSEEFFTFDDPNDSGWFDTGAVGWGFNAPASSDVAPDDTGVTAIPTSGSSFRAPNGTTAVTWVQFRPDGVPVAIDNACNVGRLGSGGGTIYLWSQNRDFAITLSPLGGVRVHTWNAATGAWTT